MGHRGAGRRQDRPGAGEPGGQCAASYAPRGAVRIEVSRPGDKVLVRVCDTGEGIPPADLPHVFERFYRGEKSRSRVTGGAGLGLAIAKGIVEAHNGQIWAENTAGAGVCFAFVLPDRGSISNEVSRSR